MGCLGCGRGFGCLAGGLRAERSPRRHHEEDDQDQESGSQTHGRRKGQAYCHFRSKMIKETSKQ